MKLLLVCSAGGHFFELHSLQELWREYERAWVTFPKEDTKSLLKNEITIWAYSPTNRNIKNFFKNFTLAIKILFKEKPNVIISSGAGVAVPFIYIGRILGIKTIFIELMTRVETLSLSAKLIYPVVHHLLVQWPEMETKYRKAIFRGQVV